MSSPARVTTIGREKLDELVGVSRALLEQIELEAEIEAVGAAWKKGMSARR